MNHKILTVHNYINISSVTVKSKRQNGRNCKMFDYNKYK